MYTLEKLRAQLPEQSVLPDKGLWCIKGGNSDKRGDRPGTDPPPPPPPDSVLTSNPSGG